MGLPVRESGMPIDPNQLNRGAAVVNRPPVGGRRSGKLLGRLRERFRAVGGASGAANAGWRRIPAPARTHEFSTSGDRASRGHVRSLSRRGRACPQYV